MAFSRGQAATAWTSFAVMGGMLLYPPWFWAGDAHPLAPVQTGAGFHWIWSPRPSAEQGCARLIWWRMLVGQWLLVAIGMLLMLFLREARERKLAIERCPRCSGTAALTQS